MKADNIDKLGEIIDSLESLAAGLNLPLPPSMHIDQLKILLPEKASVLKEVYEDETGENPWE